MSACERVGSNTASDYTVAPTGIPHAKVNLYVDNVFDREAPIRWRDGRNAAAPQFRTFGAAASHTF